MKYILVIIFLFLSGCAYLPKWLGGGTDQPPAPIDPTAGMTKFSEQQNVLVPSNREYRKMTRSKMEEESELYAHAGSTWVMEGQGAYLFTQNKTRRDGDILKVKLEGMAQKQVDTKVSVIKKLLKQLEEDESKQKQIPLKTASADGDKAKEDGKKADVSRAPASKDDKEEPLSLDAVPTKIIEKLADGNYRIKGGQPFMIGKREYNVIITGVIRPEDFNDDGVSSNKLIDPQYEVVSIRRNQQ
jgi:flagellar L-ring protein precursor FlgH